MSAALSPDDLRGLLEDERTCLHRMSQVLEEERAAAATHDLEGLLAALKAREAAQAVWTKASRARQGRVTRADMDRFANEDEGLRELRLAIRAEAAAVERSQRVNEALVRAALRGVGEVLGVLRQESPGARYDDRAALTDGLPVAAGSHWSA